MVHERMVLPEPLRWLIRKLVLVEESQINPCVIPFKTRFCELSYVREVVPI